MDRMLHPFERSVPVNPGKVGSGALLPKPFRVHLITKSTSVERDWKKDLF